MSNIALVYPNRAIEVQKTGNVPTGLYAVDWTENANLPLANILTDCLPETARTAQTHCSFAISLKKIPYRTIGAAALLNHNLTTSARIKHTVFNEPPIGYSKSAFRPTIPNRTVSFILNKPLDVATTRLALFPISNDPQDTNLPWIVGNIQSYTPATGLISLYITESSVTTNPPLISNWYVADATFKNPAIVNVPKWVNVWQRIFAPESPLLVWESSNFWTGTIEEEQRNGYTKLCLNFLDSAAGVGIQPTGTHIHIDISDPSNTDGYIEIGYFMFGQYFQSEYNPEYGNIAHGYLDNSQSKQADSGQKYFHEKSKARTITINYSLLSKAEAFNGIFEAYRQQGISRPIIYAFSPIRIDNHQYAQSFIGRFTQLNPLTQPSYGIYGATINIEEML